VSFVSGNHFHQFVHNGLFIREIRFDNQYDKMEHRWSVDRDCSYGNCQITCWKLKRRNISVRTQVEGTNSAVQLKVEPCLRIFMTDQLNFTSVLTQKMGINYSTTVEQNDSITSPHDNSFIPGLEEVDTDDVARIIQSLFCQEQSYDERRQTLETIRHLVKSPEIYSLIPQDKYFYESLLKICSDGSDYAFNKESWKFFFQLIEFHEGVIEQTIYLDVLGKYVQLIECKDETVSHHARHYFSKILTLPNETGRAQLLADDEDPVQRENNFPEQCVVEQYGASVQKLCDYMTKGSFHQVLHLPLFKYVHSCDTKKEFPFMNNFYSEIQT
jgi:anthranilate/para-aminobenzoate synthase component I